VRTAHKDWYGELFQPCVSAGFIPVGAHSRATAMMQCICAHRATYLRDGRRSETRCRHCSICSKRKPIRAFAPFSGNGLFGYIHPYRDGNGRMARFLMNAMLASGGYPWTVIRVEDRDAYLGALDRASIDANIQPFATFIAERVQWSFDQATGAMRLASAAHASRRAL